MPKEYMFVSCYIVAHLSQNDVSVQKEHVFLINKIVNEILRQTTDDGLVWASGGDGGHHAFPINSRLQFAIELITLLRGWSLECKVPLKITACHRPVDIIEGADGRIQLVGHGINLAGRLLLIGGPSFVIVTEAFCEHLKDQIDAGIKFHDKRLVTLKNFASQEVYLLSVENVFESRWETQEFYHDRLLLQAALNKNDFLEVIYRARRLLEINSKDSTANDALYALARRKIRPQTEDTFLCDLFMNIQFGPEVIYAGHLINAKRERPYAMLMKKGKPCFLF